MKKTHVLELSNNPWKCTCSSEITQRVSTYLLFRTSSGAKSWIFFKKVNDFFAKICKLKFRNAQKLCCFYLDIKLSQKTSPEQPH